jgi:2-polyprenyl-3-methyl-5-hydroxy-6-metoxy-1,4-benzoquinol methylase
MKSEYRLNSKGLEYISCNLCGGEDTELVFEAPVRPHRVGIFARDTWDIVRCKQCGLIFVNPRPDSDAQKSFYTFENPSDMAYVKDWFLENADLNKATWKRYLNAIQRFCPEGRLLDVGCGAGSFLSLAQETGFEVYGQEVSDFFIDYCRSQLGINVFAGELEDINLEPGSFDCVTAFDVIEHHPYPRLMLETIHHLLKPGGYTVISTHDIGNFYARLYGSRWRQIAPIGHLTYFTRSTLRKMLNAAGFEIAYTGGLHTIDGNTFSEARNHIYQFTRVVLLRGLILGLYKPLATRMHSLTRWQFNWKGNLINHDKLLLRAGNQIVMNDDMVMIARAIRE